MVWAEMVMGRNGHGSKWLWAEMTSDLLFLLNKVSLSFIFIIATMPLGLVLNRKMKNQMSCGYRVSSGGGGRGGGGGGIYGLFATWTFRG